MDPNQSGVVTAIAIHGLPEFKKGDPIADIVIQNTTLNHHDVIVVTSKIVSKVEGRIIQAPNDGFTPEEIHAIIIGESRRVLRQRGQLVITETQGGFVCANAGIDQSNMPDGSICLLPADPDRSARRIRDRIKALIGIDVAVIISDTFGRAWRRGVTDIALGSAGIGPISDLRGTLDSNGRPLVATEIAIVDEIAATAELTKPKSGAIPVVIVRGIDPSHFREGSVKDEIIRPYGEDLFR
ncbi:coenzyme F420-0:L-glutamate ligase [Acidithrix sp. C25]|uniref:coenzyme F420-0:L-glutamate ligase n=1 Tax=Acidithrix sp. C25 TaxID=1671482 RepID=UPI00191B9185|nr:coenzyme F420-0:L-glutamate ligase [Acidithrix sp. C25]